MLSCRPRSWIYRAKPPSAALTRQLARAAAARLKRLAERHREHLLCFRRLTAFRRQPARPRVQSDMHLAVEPLPNGRPWHGLAVAPTPLETLWVASASC